MSSSVKAFPFEGSEITFYNKEGELFLNATEMAKPFGEKKKPVLWLRTQTASDFLSELSKVRKCTLADLQRVIKGGNSSGTWFHKDVAVEFARWLSPKFCIWCNDRIQEILTTGKSELFPNPKPRPNTNYEVPQTFSDALLLAAKQAKQLEEVNALAEKQQGVIEKQNVEIKEMKGDSDYCKTVLRNEALVTTTSIAQDYGYSAWKFNYLLHEFGIQYKNNSQWILTARYKGKGYVQSETIAVGKDDNHLKIIVNTKWTQKGRRFLYDFLKGKNILPMIERNTKCN